MPKTVKTAKDVMKTAAETAVPTPNMPVQSTLLALKDANKLATEMPLLDVRGWSVKGSDGADLGTVDRIMLDTVEQKPRYLSVRQSSQNGQLLLPVGVGTPDVALKEVKVEGLKPEAVRAIPVLAGDMVNDDFERQVFSAVTGKTAQTLAARDWYEDPVFDAGKLMVASKAKVTS